jgi:hypothetical protein
VTDPRPAAPDREAAAFAHASEAEMARILDFYAVDWQYEPVTFPILWNIEGDVVESFSPDFYLPDLDLFLEMTTLKQRLVRKKNRKLRRLRELYPDIRIKLFYARDFRAMMLKYGRFGLVESLSGTLGQIVPDRSEPRSGVAPIAVADVIESAGRVESVEFAEPPEPILPVVVTAPSADLPSALPSSVPGSTRARRRRRRPVSAAARSTESVPAGVIDATPSETTR